MAAITRLAPVLAHIGEGSTVRRFVPQGARRRIGAFCFFDHFGPVPAGAGGMDVGPHPHTGLQTASWLFEGEVLHVDSAGGRAAIRPGQLNLMTAGRGIAHTEDLGDAPRGLHGAQLWIALPEAERARPPRFAHHGELPRVRLPGVEAIVGIGEFGGAISPAQVFSPLLLAELQVSDAPNAEIPLQHDFEHGVLVAEGRVTLDGEFFEAGEFAYLPPGASALRLTGPARLLLIGGEPFPEPLLMSWNWVVRTADELDLVRAAWAAGEGHGDLSVFGDRPRLSAPPLAGRPVAR